MFQVHDIVTDKVKEEYDLILSRHTMQHLKTRDVQSILRNFASSGSKYLLATNYPYLDVRYFTKEVHYLLSFFQENTELDETTQMRMRGLNLFLNPYQLPLPICQHWDAIWPDIIMLWDLRTLPLP